eukprot:Rhum_TRINITY_DN14427_c7_g1::Rhum_TRINITY_DN14427_c7_g1_i1::g.89800::m.89800
MFCLVRAMNTETWEGSRIHSHPPGCVTRLLLHWADAAVRVDVEIRQGWRQVPLGRRVAGMLVRRHLGEEPFLLLQRIQILVQVQRRGGTCRVRHERTRRNRVRVHHRRASPAGNALGRHEKRWVKGALRGPRLVHAVVRLQMRRLLREHRRGRHHRHVFTLPQRHGRRPKGRLRHRPLPLLRMLEHLRRRLLAARERLLVVLDGHVVGPVVFLQHLHRDEADAHETEHNQHNQQHNRHPPRHAQNLVVGVRCTEGDRRRKRRRRRRRRRARCLTVDSVAARAAAAALADVHAVRPCVRVNTRLARRAGTGAVVAARRRSRSREQRGSRELVRYRRRRGKRGKMRVERPAGQTVLRQQHLHTRRVALRGVRHRLHADSLDRRRRVAQLHRRLQQPHIRRRREAALRGVGRCKPRRKRRPVGPHERHLDFARRRRRPRWQRKRLRASRRRRPVEEEVRQPQVCAGDLRGRRVGATVDHRDETGEERLAVQAAWRQNREEEHRGAERLGGSQAVRLRKHRQESVFGVLGRLHATGEAQRQLSRVDLPARCCRCGCGALERRPAPALPVVCLQEVGVVAVLPRIRAHVVRCALARVGAQRGRLGCAPDEGSGAVARPAVAVFVAHLTCGVARLVVRRALSGVRVRARRRLSAGCPPSGPCAHAQPVARGARKGVGVRARLPDCGTHMLVHDALIELARCDGGPHRRSNCRRDTRAVPVVQHSGGVVDAGLPFRNAGRLVRGALEVVRTLRRRRNRFAGGGAAAHTLPVVQRRRRHVRVDARLPGIHARGSMLPALIEPADCLLSI